jgi:hypothetical protein
LPASYADSAFITTHGLESNYCRNPDSANKDTMFCFTTDPLTVTEACEPMKDYEVFNAVSNIQIDPHLVNITQGS